MEGQEGQIETAGIRQWTWQLPEPNKPNLLQRRLKLKLRSTQLKSDNEDENFILIDFNMFSLRYYSMSFTVSDKL